MTAGTNFLNGEAHRKVSYLETGVSSFKKKEALYAPRRHALESFAGGDLQSRMSS